MRRSTRMMMLGQIGDDERRREERHIGFDREPNGNSYRYPERRYTDDPPYRWNDEPRDYWTPPRYPEYHYRQDGDRQRMIRAGGTFWMDDPNETSRSARQMDDSAVQMDEKTATAWVKRMKNADGTTGGHWQPEQVEPYRQSICPECPKWAFFAAMNMCYSDYCEAFARLGISKPEVYAHMAKAFLNDSDAGEHKIEKYLNYIVRQ